MCWIDYNKNGSFDDAGELVFDAGASNSATTQTGSFQVPCDAPTGNTRMRISMKYNGAPTSCETFDHGEVEDYTVDIQPFVVPSAIMPASSNTTYTANTASTDAAGWTHYIYYDGTTEYLLLSLKPDAAETQLAISPADVTTTTESTITESLTHTGSPTDYITNPDGWYTFNRYWNVVPSAQPLLPVKVRSYFTNTEFTAVQTLANNNGATITDHTDLIFYKVTGFLPSDHYNIPSANITLYTNGAPHSGDFWALGTNADNYYAELFVNSFSGGGGGTGGSQGSPSLPVELVSFNGVAQEQSVKLDWETSSEVNSWYYEVERFMEESSFEVVAKLDSRNLPIGAIYTSHDNAPKKGSNYYRLKMVDLDGSFKYSKIINIVFDKQQDINIYPNPNRGREDMFIRYFSDQSSTLDIMVYAQDGTLINTKQYGLESGSNELLLPFRKEMPAGVYILQVKDGRQEYHYKIVLMD